MCFVCSRVFFAVAATAVAVVVALASPLRVFPSMQKIASAAFYYALFVQKPNFLFLWLLCPWTIELERSQKQESNWHFVYRLKMKKEENTHEENVKQRSFQSFIVNKAVDIAVAAAVNVGLSVTFIHSFTCLFFFQEIRESQWINTISTDISLARIYPLTLSLSCPCSAFHLFFFSLFLFI